MKSLDIPFKGGRTYLHATDMYNCFYNVFRDTLDEMPDSTKLSVRKMAHNSLSYTTTKYSEKPVISVFEATSASTEVKYYAYESDKKVIRNVDFDEADIVRNARIVHESKEAIIRNYDRYSISELGVALLKELCNQLITDSVKWTCVEISYQTHVPLYTLEAITVTLVKNIGTKMVVGHISLNDNKTGLLKFSSK